MVFVTGGTGFLGSYILKKLIENNIEVIAIRRSSKLPFYIPSEVLKKVNWIEGDILDISVIKEAMKSADMVIHTAAIVSFSSDERNRMYKVNIEGTENVINAALESNVNRFVHVSSVAALGRTTTSELVNENKKWEKNKNNTHYAITKQKAEMNVWRGFAEGLNGVIVNPSTIIGFGDWDQSSCAIFKNAYKEFPWYTNGLNGFVGVEDVATLIVRLIFSSISEQRFIINAENWEFRRLFTTIADYFHKKAPHREAGKLIGNLAWRIESIRSSLTGNRPLLTKETYRIAHSQTSFDNSALLNLFPDFQYTPLENVIQKACSSYIKALQDGVLTL
jgi:Nucleoside-diphosphate-sugar epimerases